MKKICLPILGMYINCLAAFSQTADSTSYQNRKLTMDESNIVSSYYHQNGNHSAVTGGIGTEKLMDVSVAFDIKLSKYDKKYRKHSLDIGIGVDHYTSASSDKIDPTTISSASHADTRIYPSLNWTMENDRRKTTFGAGASVSVEFDYTSLGMNAQFAKTTNNKMGEFAVNVQAYLDNVKIILPIELRQSGSQTGHHHDDNYPTVSRNSFSADLSYSQIINRNFQMMFLAGIIYQHGYLSLPFHRIYFKDGAGGTDADAIEKLPNNRVKIPLGVRANYFLGDRFILRGFYRFYYDTWKLNAHTFNLEFVYKITPFYSITPFYRFHIQSAIAYFAPKGEHLSSETYYSSNYDLSAFNSHFFGAGIRLAPPKGIFGWKHFNMLEIRYGHYIKTTGMLSDIVSLNIRFK